MRSSLLQALILLSGLVGCSSSAFRGQGGAGQDRLDVLTSFSLALSKYDFREAANYLAPADRAKLAGPQEGILPEYRERIRAIRRATLMNNPLIEVREGLIYGIPDILPVLALGEADSVSPPDVREATMASARDSSESARAKEQEDLQRTAAAFFKAVSRRDWRKAMGYLAPQEREDFLDGKGSLKASARDRLAAIDTSGWESLTLRDGRLTGVVLIIPENRSESLRR